MHYYEVLPRKALRKYILNYWMFKGPLSQQTSAAPLAHTAPADGCVSLFLVYQKSEERARCLVMGPSTTIIRSTVYPDSVCLGIRAYPAMAEAAFGVSAKELRNRVICGEAVLERFSAQPLLEALDLNFSDFTLLDDMLAPRVPLYAEAVDEEVCKAVREIMLSSGNIALAGIKKAASISERQLQKRFLKAVGLSMKEFAGTCRFRAIALELLVHHRDLFDALLENGYYDQAHFLHHLKKLTRSKPGAFKNHVQKIKHQGVASYQQLASNNG